MGILYGILLSSPSFTGSATWLAEKSFSQLRRADEAGQIGMSGKFHPEEVMVLTLDPVRSFDYQLQSGK
jgi:hypothetical protein